MIFSNTSVAMDPDTKFLLNVAAFFGLWFAMLIDLLAHMHPNQPLTPIQAVVIGVAFVSTAYIKCLLNPYLRVICVFAIILHYEEEIYWLYLRVHGYMYSLTETEIRWQYDRYLMQRSFDMRNCRDLRGLWNRPSVFAEVMEEEM